MNFDRKQIMQDAWEAHRAFLFVMKRPFSMEGFGERLKASWAKARRYAVAAQKRALKVDVKPTPKAKIKPAIAPIQRTYSKAEMLRLMMVNKDRLSAQEIAGL